MQLWKMAVLILGLTAAPAQAQDTRVVTDHAGYEVEVPAAPKRVVSLSDWTTTLMLHELGLEPVGSVGRMLSDGAYIRGGRELYGLEFGETLELASVHGALDVERIAALKPDLIVGLRSDTIALRDNLSLVAPVLLFDTENGKAPLDNYADFAGWLGLEAEFDALNDAYEARIADYLSQRGNSADLGTYLVLRSNPEDGNITIYRTFGAMTTVLDDIGFAHPPIVDTVPADEQRSVISAEMIGEMNADYIFAGHMEDRGETAATSLEQLEMVAPGSGAFLKAVRNERFISLSRFHISSPTFAAMHYFLDHLELRQ